MDLRSRTADGLHGGFIGDELKSGTRHFARDAIQEIKRELNALRGMVRHKTACEELSCRATRGKGNLLIAVPVRQEIDTRERSGIRRGDTCISMPGRAVHPDSVI